MKPRITTMVHFIKRSSYKKYNGFPPCHLDICMCMVNLNLKDSYSDQIHYKNCYNRNLSYTKVFDDPLYNSFEYSSDKVI